MSHAVTELGYVGIDATDLDRWRRWGELIGATLVDDTEGGFGLRLDSDAGWRIAVRAAERDGVAFAGWEVPDAATLRELRSCLEKAGAQPKERPDLALMRGVEELLTFVDPDGNVGELYWGRGTLIRTQFISPHGVEFSVADQGMGHLTIGVADFRRTFDFYTAVLGMSLTEIADVGGNRVGFLRCNPRHHSLAFAELPPGQARVLHLAVEVEHLDALGSIRDRLLDEGFSPTRDLGRHPTDGVISLYLPVCEAFDVELGWGSITVDDETWPRDRHERISWSWGHRPPTGPATALGSDVER